MKTLYLVRHAKSSWEDHSLDDFDRPLNERGKRDAPFMGKKLLERGLKPDVVVSSPAKRAKKTAIKVCHELGIDKSAILFKDKIYATSVQTLLNVLGKLPNAAQHAMLFGHNPELTALSNYLCDYVIHNIPTTGVVGIEFQVSSWAQVSAGKGKFLFFDYPKRYFRE
jgi:phosphohistidine phosphatase